MTPDKKVEEYLERARTVIVNQYKKTNGVDMKISISKDLIEIAKMIQLEEHREQK